MRVDRALQTVQEQYQWTGLVFGPVDIEKVAIFQFDAFASQQRRRPVAKQRWKQGLQMRPGKPPGRSEAAGDQHASNQQALQGAAQ